MDNNKKYMFGVKKKLTKHSKLFSNSEKILFMMKQNKGYITTKEIDNKKLGRDYLKKLVDSGKIKNVARGIYFDYDLKENKMYTFQMRYPKTIFSHLTALSLWKIIDYNKINYDITCCNNVFCEEFKLHNVFYVKKEVLKIGLVEIEIDGYQIKLYDMERCICDIIRSKGRIENKLIEKCLKNYLKNENKNIQNLIRYAKELEIYNQLTMYLEKFKRENRII